MTDRELIAWLRWYGEESNRDAGNRMKLAADRIEALTAERDRLAAIVERLPKTADGVPVYACERLWVPPYQDPRDGEIYGPHDGGTANPTMFVLGRNAGSYCGPVEGCRYYSTREAAEAAIDGRQ